MRIALAALVVACIALLPTVLVLAAETPFGIGNGIVPDLVGRDNCEGLVALEERGLRWTDGQSPPESHPPDCGRGDPTGRNEIVRQDPAPGTDLGEGGVVRVRYECHPPECMLD